jgi:putative transposase
MLTARGPSPLGDRGSAALRFYRHKQLDYISGDDIVNSMETRYRRNCGAVYSLKYHIVWCPKYRRPVLEGKIRQRLETLLRGKAKELEIEIHEMSISPDHVHLFIESDPVLCVAEIVNRFKGYTSHELRQEFSSLRSRLPTLWSRRYYDGTIGGVSADAIKKYIENQKDK